MSIKEIAKKVDDEFKRYFKEDSSIKSIFVAKFFDSCNDSRRTTIG